MANEGVRIPMGSGGLVRYSEEDKSKIQIKPQYVIVLIVITVIFELILNGLGR